MLEATPQELPIIEGSSNVAVETDRRDRQWGPEGFGPASDQVGSFTLQAAGNPYLTPLKWSGRLFHTKPAGRDFGCSAQFIKPRVILTAAHCVRDRMTGIWFKDFRFALQYHQEIGQLRIGREHTRHITNSVRPRIEDIERITDAKRAGDDLVAAGLDSSKGQHVVDETKQVLLIAPDSRDRIRLLVV